jgi:phosphoglycolate phosphatase
MDGTLINSGTIIANTINHVRQSIGLKPMEQKLLLTKVNDPKINSAQFFYNSEVFLEHHIKLFEEYYMANFHKEISLYEGIEKLLLKLEDNEYDLSIATNASNKFAQDAIRHLSIDKYFKYTIGFDNVSKPKPDPQMFLKTLQDLNQTSNNAIVIGDSHKDLIAAKKANIKCELVNWGFTHHDNAHYDVDSLYKSIIS